MSTLLKEDIPVSAGSEKSSKKVIVKDSAAIEAKIPLLSKNKIKSDGSSGNNVLNENKKQPPKKRTFKKGGRRTRKGKRKHTHQAALSSSAATENQVSNKKRKLIGGDQPQATASSRTTVKLASAPFTPGRKRGAEVLTLELVNDDKPSETETTASNKRNKESNTALKNKVVTGKQRKTAPAEDTFVRDRPPKRKASEPGNRSKLPEVKSKSENGRRAAIKRQEPTGKQSRRSMEFMNTVSLEPISSPSKSSTDLGFISKQSTELPSVPEIDKKRISMYESHALNLLADLALNSLSSSSISYINSENAALADEFVDQEKLPSDDSGKTGEYTQNDCSPPLKSSSASEDPVQAPDDNVKSPQKVVSSDASNVNSTTQHRAENTEKQASHKVLIAAAKAKARNNTTSKISLEHSYSQLPKDNVLDKSSKEQNENPCQNVSEPVVTSPDNEEEVDQSSDLLFPKDSLLESNDSGCLSLNNEPREVSKCHDKLSITFKWEAQYDFDMDSKFTSDPLEKTINRALHGPWNPHLKEKVEDVKIILHMWLALFYSKPGQQQSISSRKVVEHSNPAKYVSINTVHDPLYDNAEADADDITYSDDPQIMPDASPEWHGVKEDGSSNQPVDLSVASRTQSKDIYVNLPSEIFQIYNKSSMSTLYTDSLQTMLCKMTSTSKVTPPPTNYTNTIFSANIPSVCFTDDSKQFNNELTAKSETCVAIGGGSSGKDKPRENEHKYSKYVSVGEETACSSGSERNLNMLHEDSCSTVGKNEEKAKNYDGSISPQRSSHTHADSFALCDDGLPVIGNESHPWATRSEVLPQDYPSVTSSTVVTEVLPSNALNIKSTSDVFHEDDEHSDHSETTEEDLLKKRSPLVSSRHSMQNKHANSKQNEAMLESADGKKLLEAKLQGVNMDSDDLQNSEDKLDTSNGHLVIASKEGSELGKCEENTYNNSDLKPSCFEENQTDTKVCNHEDLSPLKSLNCDSNASPLQDEKVSESRIQTVPTLESSRTSSISLELVHSEKSSTQVESQDEATRSKESIKEVDTCIGTERNEGKDCPTDPDFTGNSFKEAKASSSTNEDALGSPKQCLDEPTKNQESSSLAENDTNEVLDLSPGCPSYSQESEHSYVGKVASFGNMGKLELSPSSVEISDVEDMDMDNDGKSCPESPENANKDSYSKEKSNLVDTSPGSPRVVFQQDDASSPKDDRSHVNQNKKDAADNTDHSTEINESEKTEESLPVGSRSPLPPSDPIAEKTSSLNTVSEGFQSKGTDSDDHTFPQSNEVENISETDEKDPCDNTDPFSNQEIRPLISVEISGKHPKTCFGDKPSMIESEYSKATELEENRALLVSEFSKPTDVESLGNKLSLGGLESNMAADLQSQVEKSLLSKSESSEAANLNDMAEKSSLHNTVSSKPEDSQCIFVFEELNSKTVSEVNLTPISTNVEKQELQILDIENLHTEKETMEKNLSVELLNTHTGLNELVTLDQMIPNNMQTENSCEVLQTPSSEPLDEVIPLDKESKANETKEDSDSVALQAESRCVDGNLDQLPVETLSDSISDFGSVRVSPSEPKKSTKVQTQIMKNKTRTEILSKLKLICQGSGINQQTSSNSEDEVFIVHEKPGRWHTEEQKKLTENKMVDVSKPEINTEDLVGSTRKTQENQTPASELEMVQEIAANSPTTLVEHHILQEPKLNSQDKCVSPPNDDFTDHIEHDPEQDQSEICCILNTGSISKEQYDRWSETSDDDIEFIKAYKEPLLRIPSNYLQKESHDFSSPPPEEPVSYPERSRKTKPFTRHLGPSTSLWEEDEYISRYHRGADPNPKNHGSFIITRKLKDVEKSLPTVRKERFSARRSDLDSIFSNSRRVSSDLTQNTLDMEHLRFMCRLKDVLRKSSTNIHVSEPPFQTLFDSSRVSSGTSSRTKCINPLLITVNCTNRRRNYRGHDGSFQSTSYSQAYYEEELWDKPTYYSRTPKKARTSRYSPPYHFNRLKYESSQEKANSDISVIIKECTQSNHLKLNRVGLGSTVVERTSACPAPEERGWQVRQTFDPTSTRSRTVGNIISDHCTNLHSKLQSVARDSAQKNSYFYISKANDDHDDDDDFLSSTESFLMKDGYIPIEPQDFCDQEESESNKLLVLIRNENISAQIHKIPCLLQLRLLPNVMFAGVDTPEDLSESMYQELLQSGGFVVSYKSLLENISTDKLKEALIVLQKMNRTSSWKWLIHYGEYRKLKEDKRAESASRIKMSLLKSYQQSNIVEILPYHRCDSRSKDPSSDLECLLNLQSQHIRSRLAVCLAAMPSSEAEEFEHNGILVYDVDTFIRRIQKVDARLQPSFWG